MGLQNWIRNIGSTASASLQNWLASWSTSKQPPSSSMTPPASLAGPVPAAATAAVSTVNDFLYDPFSGADVDQSAVELGLVETPWNPGETSPQPMFSPEEQAALSGGWHQMASSNVDEVRYLLKDKILEVIFLNGYVYQYYDVPANVYLDFLKTDSPGRFVWNVLRADGYAYARIGPGVFPIFQTGNVRKTANVVRRLLPEEIRGNKAALDRLKPGEAVRLRSVPLEQANWRADNVRATPAQIRARNRARRGRR